MKRALLHIPTPYSIKQISIVILFFIMQAACYAQPRQTERLKRGLVAMKTTENYAFISWRLLINDVNEIAFNLYRVTGNKMAVKLNEKPLTNATNYLDKTVDFKQKNTYQVKPVVENREHAAEGDFTIEAGSKPKQYISIPLRTPDRYTPGDCSAADLDGDGEYEIIVHQIGIGKDNSQEG